MSSVVSILDKDGSIKVIEPYNQKIIDQYHLIWRDDVLNPAIKQLRDYKKDFDVFYSQLDNLDRISQTIPSLKKDFNTFLVNDMKYDESRVVNIVSDCWKKFEEHLIINLKNILNIKLDEHIKKVIGRYYMTCDEISDWDHTIGIIEVFRDLCL